MAPKYARANTRGKRAYNVYMSTSETAQRALSLATSLTSLINVEYKYFDITGTPTASTTGTVTQLTAMAVGDGASNRDGESVKIKSIQTNWYATKHSSATHTHLRMMWVLDTNGTSAPGIAQVIGSGFDTNSFRNLDYRKRFVILKDIKVNLSDHTSTDGSYYKKMNMDTLWLGTAGADMVSNHLYFIVFSNEATNAPTFYVRHRLRYLDN